MPLQFVLQWYEDWQLSLKKLGIQLEPRCDCKCFEMEVIEDIRQYYQTVAKLWIPKLSAKEFVKVLQHLRNDQQNDWLKQLKNKQTGQAMIDVVRKELSQALDEAAVKMFNRCIIFGDDPSKTQTRLLANDHGNADDVSKTDLYCICDFYKTNDIQMEAMANAMQQAVENTLGNIMDDLKKLNDVEHTNYTCIVKIIKVHRHCRNFIKSCNSHGSDHINVNHVPLFERALKKAFVAVIHDDETDSNLFQILLASFCNDILRKTNKEKNRGNQSEFDATVQDIGELCKCMKKKDVFERDYEHFLASRLLKRLSNEKHERSMISRLDITISSRIKHMYCVVLGSKWPNAFVRSKH